jgi:hypothetical protein
MITTSTSLIWPSLPAIVPPDLDTRHYHRGDSPCRCQLPWRRVATTSSSTTRRQRPTWRSDRLQTLGAQRDKIRPPSGRPNPPMPDATDLIAKTSSSSLPHSNLHHDVFPASPAATAMKEGGSLATALLGSRSVGRRLPLVIARPRSELKWRQWLGFAWLLSRPKGVTWERVPIDLGITYTRRCKLRPLESFKMLNVFISAWGVYQRANMSRYEV